MKNYMIAFYMFVLILCALVFLILGNNSKEFVVFNTGNDDYDFEEFKQDNKEEDVINTDIVDISKSEYTYKEMVEDLNKLNSRYRGKMYLDVIGTTYDKRNIYEVIFGNKNAKNHVLVHAGIHGSEYLNCLLLMKQLEYYLADYDEGSFRGVSYKTLFNNTAFHIIPMVNPDGVTISQCGVDKIINHDLKESIGKCYKRDLEDNYTSESYENYLKRWKANARGVDLNRNFNASWYLIHQSSHPSFENYKGYCYESEKETQALVNLTNKYDFKMTISYHSSGELIYWDYKECIDRNACSKIADIAEMIIKYQKAQSDSSYSNVVSGGYKDWASSNKKHFIPSITIETGKGTCPLDISEFNDMWKKNLYLWAAYSYYFYKK